MLSSWNLNFFGILLACHNYYLNKIFYNLIRQVMSVKKLKKMQSGCFITVLSLFPFKYSLNAFILYEVFNLVNIQIFQFKTRILFYFLCRLLCQKVNLSMGFWVNAIFNLIFKVFASFSNAILASLLFRHSFHNFFAFAILCKHPILIFYCIQWFDYKLYFVL